MARIGAAAGVVAIGVVVRAILRLPTRERRAEGSHRSAGPVTVATIEARRRRATKTLLSLPGNVQEPTRMRRSTRAPAAISRAGS